MDTPFWRRKSLEQLDDGEWESLCDGCAKCCLNKIEDEDTGELFFTNAACRLLDIDRCRCRDYRQRTRRVPECLDLRSNGKAFGWLPSSCSYRRLAKGQELPAWHPLRTGEADSVHRAGESVRGYAVSEDEVERLTDHVIEWLI